MATLSDKLIFFLGVNTGFVANGEPDRRFLDFYRERSSPALHCAIVGNVVVPGGYGSNSSSPTISSSQVWRHLAAAICDAGSIPGVQLATAWKGYEGARKFLAADGDIVLEQARQLIQQYSRADLARLMGAFRKGAAMAIGHGFRHVQTHAAHGYLLSLLVDDRLYPLAAYVRDELNSLADWLRTQSIESSLRISLRTGNNAFDEEGAERAQDFLCQLAFDFIDLSSGFYNINKRLIYPARPDILVARHQESLAVALRHPQRCFIVSGRVSPKAAHHPANSHIGICRDLIANPAFLAQPHDGCRNANKCHYYSRGEDHISCVRWSGQTS
ncbi:hypothetical protein BFL28_13285 [Sphingomonas turrisvirgatae]|uniref:Uncharacterized protein n=2 Tax=Sphingomonadaceae TaxID=41297 RepID=A0A1E3LYE9_9SPHN|nr:hypothetical protein BFL28_13285 [Sphingomonas turrisvirgatae]